MRIVNEDTVKRIFRFIIFGLCLHAGTTHAQIADEKSYLKEIIEELKKKWPDNRTINLVFHGHSVPSGYFNTPQVKTLQSYPHLVLQAVKEKYPSAVVNVITTSIGGEQAEQGNLRLEDQVLTHRPDVLFIDYALNDRRIGLEKAREAWASMITKAKKSGVKVVLLTPTPDLQENILDTNASLQQHSSQIRDLASRYHVGLVDVYASFKKKAARGESLSDYMSQHNHPNEKGHSVVRELIMAYLIEGKLRGAPVIRPSMPPTD